MPKKIDEPCPICGGPCSTWAISDDPNEDMVLCWQGDYKVRGLENHKRLSGIVALANKTADAFELYHIRNFDDSSVEAFESAKIDFEDCVIALWKAVKEIVQGRGQRKC